ncbi:MAG: class II aldolase/adducin family protein [Methanosarcinales archaeon]|nr:MAG: class II aldolase/adducin family protein [Methanosarcinales archaeon]
MEHYMGRKFRTTFVKDTIAHEREMREMIETGKKLKLLGMTPNFFGNLSIRVDDGILITAGGARLGGLKEEDVVLLKEYDQEQNIIKVVGSKEPSSETPLHCLIYTKLGCKVVIHVHDDLLLAHYNELNIPMAKYAPYGTLELAQNVLTALERGNLVAMEKHGILSIGENMGEALNRIILARTRL